MHWSVQMDRPVLIRRHAFSLLHVVESGLPAMLTGLGIRENGLVLFVSTTQPRRGDGFGGLRD